MLTVGSGAHAHRGASIGCCCAVTTAAQRRLLGLRAVWQPRSHADACGAPLWKAVTAAGSRLAPTRATGQEHGLLIVCQVTAIASRARFVRCTCPSPLCLSPAQPSSAVTAQAGLLPKSVFC